MGLAAFLIAAGLAAWSGAAAADGTPRVEARGAELFAVGVVHDDVMSIHVSRNTDNAPVRDAALSVALRGALHPAKAEADGSYTLKSADLKLPGDAAIEFHVAVNGTEQILRGTLNVAAGAAPTDGGAGRQLWWWVLNFGACFGFLYLLSRRRKKAKTEE